VKWGYCSLLSVANGNIKNSALRSKCHTTRKILLSFFISNFRRVVNVVFFLLGWFPGVWIVGADISKHSVCSIFIGSVRTTHEDGTECSVTSEHKTQTLGNHSKSKNTTVPSCSSIANFSNIIRVSFGDTFRSFLLGWLRKRFLLLKYSTSLGLFQVIAEKHTNWIVFRVVWFCTIAVARRTLLSLCKGKGHPATARGGSRVSG